VASNIGLAPSLLIECLADAASVDQIIRRDQGFAKSFQLASTPGFVLGRRGPDGKAEALKSIRGAQPISVFRRAIEAMSQRKTELR
jgi:predicted DsbA family dithiol-disulfide isomerase